MTTINDGGPAFPVWELNGKGQPEMTGFGVTLRDYFAAKAMVGQIAAGEGKYVRGYDGWRDEFAREAYRYADAMLKAREASDD